MPAGVAGDARLVAQLGDGEQHHVVVAVDADLVHLLHVAGFLAVYYSRSRGKLWFKGEESGHVQQVHQIRIDCDHDVVLLTVTQLGHQPGIACHTGRHSCFFSVLRDGAWQAVEPVLKDPESIYK